MATRPRPVAAAPAAIPAPPVSSASPTIPPTPPTPPAPPAAPAAPAPAPIPTPRPRRRRSSAPRRLFTVFAWSGFVSFGLLLVLVLLGYGLAPVRYTSAQFLNGLHERPVQMEWSTEEGRPVPRRSHRRPEPGVDLRPTPRPAVPHPAPVVPAPAPPAPKPAPVPTPPAAVTPPAAPAPVASPVSTVPAPAVLETPTVYCPKMPGTVCDPQTGAVISIPKPIPAEERIQPRRTINILSGNSLNLNVGVQGVGGWTYPYGWYGGWTAGHVERVCEPRYNGVVCFDRWVGHPLPGTWPY